MGYNLLVLVVNGELYLLKEGCIILGLFLELFFFKVGSLKVEEEVVIFFFIDGLSDIKNY